MDAAKDILVTTRGMGADTGSSSALGDGGMNPWLVRPHQELAAGFSSPGALASIRVVEGRR